MWDLPPFLYHGLQRLVHGDYGNQKRIVETFRRRTSGNTLEVGCGTGLIASFFESGKYIGVDVDGDRVEAAKKLYPDHEFHLADVTKQYHECLDKADNVIFHSTIHHINDNGVRNVLRNIKTAAQKKTAPVQLLVMEPVIPDRIVFNLPGFILAKLDRGRHVRTVSDLTALLGSDVIEAKRVKGPWFWPVPGVIMTLSVS